MKGKVCIVTGSNSGIGLETAAELARRGAAVVMACRSPEKSRQALESVHARSGSKDVELLMVDLTSLDSVREFALEFRRKYGRLDVLVNNAGLYKKDRVMTGDGFETQFQTNHLGPFLLTNLLLDLLQKSAPARIVNVSSGGHLMAVHSFSNLQGERLWNGWLQYCNTKLENILFTREISKRLEARGVTANSLHPGGVATNFAGGQVPNVLWDLGRRFMLTAAQGARTSVYLASSPEVEGVTGKYFANCRPARESFQARSAKSAARLWKVSEKLAGLSPAAAV